MPKELHLDRLVDASRKQQINAYEAVEWPERVSLDNWFMSPELISLHGTPAYEQLTEQQRQKLSFYELVNFFSISVRGEVMGIENTVRDLYRGEFYEVSPYLHHFVDEENKHMVYFGTFCTKYAGKVYPDRHMTLPRSYAVGEKEVLNYASIVIFEEILDYYNVLMSRDERVHPLSQTLNGLHHREETRHLAFGRWHVSKLFREYSPKWSPEVLERVRNHLTEYVEASWREYFNPDCYRDAGLEDAYGLRGQALSSQSSQERYRRATSKCWQFLIESGILPHAPQSTEIRS